jgi:hypothetical protein
MNLRKIQKRNIMQGKQQEEEDLNTTRLEFIFGGAFGLHRE